MNRTAAEKNQEKGAEDFRKTPGSQGTRWHSMLSAEKLAQSKDIMIAGWIGERSGLCV
ncbi:MAG TPA: hypothetical protein VKE98_16440 [Gemmataceae bacterium]|nr:hypothetical protein [Gemmataceae bacterium]